MAYPHTENGERGPAVLPDWDDFRLLLAVVHQGSFSRAAAALALTQPTVSRRIERLEKSLHGLFECAMGTPAEFPTTTPGEIMADYSAAAANSTIEYLASA